MCYNYSNCFYSIYLSFIANRPGFPFLGNDFFAALGDLFSCHAVDNPSMDSELKMLKQYGIIFIAQFNLGRFMFQSLYRPRK